MLTIFFQYFLFSSNSRSVLTLTLVGMPVKCQGLYDRRFESLHDGSAGTTSPKKLWEDARKCGKLETHGGSELQLTCELACC